MEGNSAVSVAASNYSLPWLWSSFPIIDGSPPKDHGPSAVPSPHNLLLAARIWTESIHIRTVKEGELLCQLKFPCQSILDYTFIDEGHKLSVLLEFHEEREVRIFKSQTGQLVGYLAGPSSVSTNQCLFSSTGIPTNPFSLSVFDEGWVISHGQKLICLPARIQHSSRAVHNNLLGMNLHIERAIFIDFYPNQGLSMC
jgi:hypothetical protein